MTASAEQVISDGNSVMSKFEALQGEMNCMKVQVSEVVVGMNALSQNVETQLRKVMNETLFGEDYPEFDPNISHKQAKRLAKEQNRPPPPTLNTVVKAATNQQKLSENKENADKALARFNIIVYGIEETTETDGEKRKELTQAKIDELLNFLEVDGITPAKTHRLGKFKEPSEGEVLSKPRPLKIILNSQAEAEIIVKSCKKLKDAPGHLKSLSVSHDLTHDERDNIKNLVKKAKEDSAKSPNLEFKVVGPPWQPTIKSFKKRAQTAANRTK